ncbi:MAG: sodium:solute symporter [Deltaproteobacteria bacterium]|nr:MAG: sodium:solute symporter [Deltaproteobacteria bacterium]
MSVIDWSVMLGTITFIVVYGWWKTRGDQDLQGYLRGNNELKWYTIGLSIMATQASAITFLSTPGQAYNDGMRFVQFYFGMPLAMIVICVFIVPIFYKLKVYTAYEYLESRFDLKVRLLGAFLFLLQRGLAAGITIYAPAIILSSILGWSLYATNLVIGTVVILYTVSGGTKAVSQTQKQQMIVIFIGMLIAAGIVIWKLPKGVSLDSASALAGTLGRMNIVDFSFDWNNRYTFWSGMTGGFFLMLSYFGTDQSQVQRYLSGRSITESRLGLLFNGMVKIPMQFIILFIGLLVFVFYLFVQPPIFFNTPALAKAKANPQYTKQINQLEKRYTLAFATQKNAAQALVDARKKNDNALIKAAEVKLKSAFANVQKLRANAKVLVKKAYPKAETKDSDYVFITFIMNMLPIGLIGLLLAVILSAAMSSTASELNALGTTTVVDFYRRVFKKEASDRHFVLASKAFTVFWGLVALGFATFASLLDNLIQAVNILGSIFYGTVLGIFLTAFFLKWIRSHAVFAAALIGQGVVIGLFFATKLGYLWFNLIGCALVMAIAIALNPILGGRRGENPV